MQRMVDSVSPDRGQLLATFRALAGSRMAEQVITDLANGGELPGHHSGLGHEAVGVGVGGALRADDCVQPSHRSGMMLAVARGGYTLGEAILQKFGRAPAWGAQIAHRPRTLLGVGLVGSAIPMAVGVALADQLRGVDSVTVTFFGDGAANEGAVHEAMNLAGARRLPVVFVLENNGIAISMRASESSAARDLSQRAAGYGIKAAVADGQDVLAVAAATADAVALARRGDGPTLLEVRLQRWETHAAGFRDVRSAEELAAARATDGVGRLRQQLLDRGLATEAELWEIEVDCRAEIQAALAQARSLGFATHEPEPYSAEDAERRTYAP